MLKAEETVVQTATHGTVTAISVLNASISAVHLAEISVSMASAVHQELLCTAGITVNNMLL